ncbi:enoyl-CoA hydratase-related protein [Streptomyces sp. NPDC001584]|uniref:enoyl-CoA hydratase-related protein n=1 Tax=Streptomyces sp. NPDC001584 TaxID=3154521 RepID=UPI0033299A4E
MSTETTEPVVLIVRRDGVLVVTLNRPHVRNAVNQALADAVDTALTLLEHDPGLGVGVLTGAGGHFCSGMDVKAFPDEGVPRVADQGLAGLPASAGRSRSSPPSKGRGLRGASNSSWPAT